MSAFDDAHEKKRKSLTRHWRISVPTLMVKTNLPGMVKNLPRKVAQMMGTTTTLHLR